MQLPSAIVDKIVVFKQVSLVSFIPERWNEKETRDKRKKWFGSRIIDRSQSILVQHLHLAHLLRTSSLNGSSPSPSCSTRNDLNKLILSETLFSLRSLLTAMLSLSNSSLLYVWFPTSRFATDFMFLQWHGWLWQLVTKKRYVYFTSLKPNHKSIDSNTLRWLKCWSIGLISLPGIFRGTFERHTRCTMPAIR